MTRQRYAVVGAGARAETFVRTLVTSHADVAELVAFADPNPAHIAAHNRWLVAAGQAPVAAYDSADFARMLDEQRVDVVLVTTVDATHEGYIVAALDAGRSVISEKPMTTTADSCTRILAAAAQARARGAGSCTVAFNYRYNPVHTKVRELLATGTIGEIGSVHFEWLLDTRHGADYFRRWHRDRSNSGGLLIHKSSHHFDLVNWWIASTPAKVYAANQLFFYGPDAGTRHGYDKGYARSQGAPEAVGDPFALDLSTRPRMKELYLDTEANDGYIRDRSVFAPGVTIDDDMAVLVTYHSGATLTYHLTAYAPWEGYRLMVNGSKGRLELEVVETDFIDRDAKPKGDAIAALYPGHSGIENGWVKLTVHPYWQKAYDVAVPEATMEAHGGGDARLIADLVSGRAAHTDPFGRRATERDGALALLTGLAANASAQRGQAVEVAELVDPALLA